VKRKIDPAVHAAMTEQRDQLQARNERLATSLRALVQQLERVGGFSTPDDQANLRIARAVLVEEER
jgi:hypothetical protein